jgi:hypothetical protein
MEVLVALFGGLISAAGVVGFGAPRQLLDGFLSWRPQSRFYFAVGGRFAFAAALLLGASTSQFSTLVFALGIIGIVSGLTVGILGQERVEKLFQSWRKRSDFVLRASSFAVALFGGFLLYAGL